MTNRLAPIILQKQREVADLKIMLAATPQHKIHKILAGESPLLTKNNFKKNLRQAQLAIIAEIKRKSPSKGNLAIIADPVALAESYIAGGAAAISVLTDEKFFGGHLEDLTAIAEQTAAPVLRKDFIIDELQIAQAVAAGASAILCIVAVVGERLKTLLSTAKILGIDVLVEVHSQEELNIALAHDVEIIGVNNRNLSTMQIDTNQAFILLTSIPDSIIKVAESGILQPKLAQDYYQAGYDAVLIGEALVTADDPEKFIRACRDREVFAE